MKPIIGITPTLDHAEKQSLLWDAYVNGILRAGGIPLILPCTTEPDVLQRYLNLVDGLLLSGGHDIEPFHYGEESLDDFVIESPTTPARDDFEIALVQAAAILDKPILGICRGHQLLNVAFGGSLYQDLNTQLPREPKLRHFQSSPWQMPSHRIQLLPGSKLTSILCDTTVKVNTLHHQAVRNPGNGIVVTGWALDGVAESLERPQNRFIIGVQWHPELMAAEDPFWLRIFSALIEASSSV